eukprot:TRINITY_DN6097_c0_g1_i1.p1 TRINITY_DN6097_c0_g1~~TRINITY_DN6097_c0_g1_i1.p1  ORF type:complete len:290 (+),score=43.68 TRINITY_DN6097_c0_g1_i1:61-930(+)
MFLLAKHSKFSSSRSKIFWSSLLRRSYTTIELTQRNNKPFVTEIALNRPEVHNAFNSVLVEELTQAFKNISKETRVVILTGKGKSFSAGADLSWLNKRITLTKEQNQTESEKMYTLFHSIKTCPVPTIARVNGHAIGGGSGLTSVCDIAIALESSSFGFTEAKLGIIPAVISPFVLEKIGKGNASRYFLTAERFKCNEAKHIGLINEFFETIEEVDKKIDNLVTSICENGPNAVSRCKKLIQEVGELDFNSEECKVFLSSVIANATVSDEGQEGTKAFLEKRPPKYQVK